MAKHWIFSIWISALVVLINGDESFEPMVAFVCDKPAMYSTEHGHSWIKDDSTGCLKDPVDVLNYCRKVFPTLDVRNVVEGSDMITVSNWCDFGVSLCDKQFTVRPFRCLVGAFQSDALLVPEHCVFDHIHDSKLCTSFSEWNRTCMQSCVDRGMVQQSFAMLQPCGIDKFSGVEFVCCPTKLAMEKGKERETPQQQQQQQQQPVVVSAPVAAASKAQRQQLGAPAKAAVKPLAIQQQQVKSHQWNEHEYYMKAKADMQKHHHDKIAKMMKDWAAARERVQEMRSRDPKGSEKLNKDITSRFQKMYEAEEIESEMEKKQLSLLHQQRVQAELNEKKEKAFESYVKTVDDNNSDAGEILNSLKRYIKSLHKDRMHTINRFQHLEDSDPEEADKVQQDTSDHLRRVDQLLTDALNMLDRVPRFKNQIVMQIQNFLHAYHLMDQDAAEILLIQPENKDLKKDDLTDDDDESDDDDDDDLDDDNDDIDDDDEEVDDDNDEDDDDDDDFEEEKKQDSKKETKKQESSSSSESKSKEERDEPVKKSDEDDDDDDDYDDGVDNDDDDDDSLDDEDKEDERVFEKPSSTRRPPVATETTRQPTTKSAAPVEVKSGFGSGDVPMEKPKTVKKQDNKIKDLSDTLVDIDYYHLKGGPSADDHHSGAANIDKDLFAVNQAYIKKTPLHSDGSSFNAAVPLGLAVAGLTVFIVIVVGVVLMRRRHNHMRPLRRLGSMDLDPSVDMGAISPEERHVASMQMNGYENPTYKYFEQQTSSNA